MNPAIQPPDFGRFEVRPVWRRQAFSRAFLVVCIATSSLSILVLAFLLTTILLGALPVLGPYEDRTHGESRYEVVQGGNPGNDPETIDAGDIIQGLVLVKRLERGGMGSANDVHYAADDGEVAATRGPQPRRLENRWQVALMSLEVQSLEGDSIARLVPATGRHRLPSILGRHGIPLADDDGSDPGMVVLTADDRSLSVEDFEYEDWFGSDVATQRRTANERPTPAWRVEWAAGAFGPDDFAELNLTQGRELGRLKLLWTLKKGTGVFSRFPGGVSRFHPVRLRPFSGEDIRHGDLKIDGAKLERLSRRQQRGFSWGGDLEWIWCPVPEYDASPIQHAAAFLKQPPRTSPDEAGIGPALMGSIWVVAGCAVFALPLGVGTAIFLEEFKPKSRWLRSLHGVLQLNIANLAGVPSIVYGILGLTAFATMFGLFGDAKSPTFQFGAEHYYQYLTEGMVPILVPVADPDSPPALTDGMTAYTPDMEPVALTVIGPDDDFPAEESELKFALPSDAEGGLVSKKAWYYFQLPLGRGVLAASLTLMLVILPVIIISSQEAIRAVPTSLREGALGLGATRWQVVREVTLPAAIPSIMTGSILSISRAIGEAAPILILCGIVYITSGPGNLMDAYSVLPIQIYYWAGLPIDETSLINFQNVAAAGIAVLLSILLTFNGIAIFIRQRTQKPLS